MGRRRWGDPLFVLGVPGIRVGRVLWHPYRHLYLIPGKNAWLLSYDPDTRRPHGLAQVINVEGKLVHLGKEGPYSHILSPRHLATSPRNAAPASTVAPQTP